MGSKKVVALFLGFHRGPMSRELSSCPKTNAMSETRLNKPPTENSSASALDILSLNKLQ